MLWLLWSKGLLAAMRPAGSFRASLCTFPLQEAAGRTPFQEEKALTYNPSLHVPTLEPHSPQLEGLFMKGYSRNAAEAVEHAHSRSIPVSGVLTVSVHTHSSWTDRHNDRHRPLWVHRAFVKLLLVVLVPLTRRRTKISSVTFSAVDRHSCGTSTEAGGGWA